MQRDPRIDFFRGMALVFLFWDHVPGNFLGQFTLRNAGFSDAAEVFVFLAGCGSMLAYGRVLSTQGQYAMAMRILGRTWTLYVAHVFVLALLMAVVFIANAQVETRDFVAEAGLTYFTDQPQRALVAGLLLGFKPMLMDPLPLYVVLMLGSILVIPALVRTPLRVIVPSVLLWAWASHYEVNLPSRPDGTWYFNPLAWQLLFVLGAAAMLPAVTGRQMPALLVRAAHRLRPAALVFLVLAALLALSWRMPEWHDAVVPEAIGRLLYPISKTHLDVLRLLHFAALVLVVALSVPIAARWLASAPARGLRCLGRHSLEVFCCGVLLVPLADMLNALAGETLTIQLLTSLGGVVVMGAVAWLLDEQRRVRARPRDVPQALPAAVVVDEPCRPRSSGGPYHD
jgi:hypothetical protein